MNENENIKDEGTLAAPSEAGKVQVEDKAQKETIVSKDKQLDHTAFQRMREGNKELEKQNKASEQRIGDLENQISKQNEKIESFIASQADTDKDKYIQRDDFTDNDRFERLEKSTQTIITQNKDREFASGLNDLQKINPNITENEAEQFLADSNQNFGINFKENPNSKQMATLYQRYVAEKFVNNLPQNQNVNIEGISTPNAPQNQQPQTNPILAKIEDRITQKYKQRKT